jgi:hypothetical protein
LFDKSFLFVEGSIGRTVLYVKAILTEKQVLAMRLGKESGAAAALLRNHLTFWSSHSSRRAIREYSGYR